MTEPHSAQSAHEASLPDPGTNGTTTSRQTPRQRCLLVAGVVGGGGSTAARVLSLAGASLPQPFSPAAELGTDLGADLNDGAWEAVALRQLQQEVLAALDASWDHDDAIADTAFGTPALSRQVEAAARIVQQVFSAEDDLLVIKDPRLGRLIPFWLRVLTRLDIEPLFVIPYRHPLAVARTLRQRYDFSLEKGLLLWLRQVLEIEAQSRRFPRIILSYSGLIANWQDALDRAAARFQCTWPALSSPQTSRDIAAFIAQCRSHPRFNDAESGEAGVEMISAMRRQHISADHRLLAWVADAYRALLTAETDETAAVSLFASLQRECDQSQLLSAALAKAQNQLAAKVQEIAGLEAAREQERSRLIKVIQERDRQLEAQATCLAALVRRRDDLSQHLRAIESYLCKALEQRRVVEAALQSLRRLPAVRTLAEIVRFLDIKRRKVEASLLADYRLVVESGLFDRTWYLIRYPDVAGHGMDPLRHYMVYGYLELRDPLPTFSASRYISEQGLKPDVNPLLHFIRVCEARMLAWSHFDQAYYLAQYPDVAQAKLNPALHFLAHGWREGRRPSANFDPDRFTGAKGLLPINNPFLDYFGHTKDNFYSKEAYRLVTESGLFDPVWYLTRYPDVVVAGCDPLQHYLLHGFREKRDPSGSFSAARYARDHGLSWDSDPLLHHIRTSLERMSAWPGFDPVYYSEQNPDIRQLGLNPALHYLAHGWREGRKPSAKENPATTREAGSDNPAHHYLRNKKAGTDGGFGLTGAAAPVFGAAAKSYPLARWQVELPLKPPHTVFPDNLGVFIHIYYDELAEEIAALLTKIPVRFSVYISTVDQTKQQRIEKAFEKHGLSQQLTIKLLPNIGWDVAPFLLGFADEIRQHDVCLRLHGKKSDNASESYGQNWRQHLFSELVGDRERVSAILDNFAADPNLGMVIPQHWEGVLQYIGITVNYEPMLRLLKPLGLSLAPDDYIDYPAGNMYWFRSRALAPVLELGLTWDSFKANPEARDGTLAHALERCLLFFVVKAGLTWAFLPPRSGMIANDAEESEALIRSNDIFDAAYYLETNPAVAQTGQDPLKHFVEQGWKEGRDPNPWFSVRGYLARNSDVVGSKQNPLVHYLKSGRAERRRISENFGLATDGHWSSLYPEPTPPVVSSFTIRPKFSFITPVYNTPPIWLEKALASVAAQNYPEWELCLVDDGSTDPELAAEWPRLLALIPPDKLKFARRPKNGGITLCSNDALALATGDYVALLDSDDELLPDALAWVVREINRDPSLDVIYSDEDKIDHEGKLSEPFYKPDWSPELFRGVMYVGHLLCARRSLVEAVGRFDNQFNLVQDFELMLRLSENTSRIHHIPRILYHWRIIPSSGAFSGTAKPRLPELQAASVNAHLARIGLNGHAVPNPTLPHRAKVLPKPRANWPKVSIMVPTRDHPELISGCLDSLFGATAYPNFEVVVIDNETKNPQAQAVIARHLAMRPGQMKVVHFAGPFHYCRANNAAAAACSGDYLMLLHNDTMVTQSDWIEPLLFLAEQADVGAVGPLLIYPDGAVQHAGIAIGPRGAADHVMRRYPTTVDGYAGSLCCSREVSAVSGACLLVKRRLWDEIGGLNSQYQHAFHDVDFCLRLRQHGLRNLYTPPSCIVHQESGTRSAVRSDDALDRAVLADVWKDVLKRPDPYHNPRVPGYWT